MKRLLYYPLIFIAYHVENRRYTNLVYEKGFVYTLKHSDEAQHYMEDNWFSQKIKNI